MEREKSKLFISYASKDAEQAMKVCDRLEAYGEQCWIAPRNITPGKEYGEEIILGINSCNAFVLLLSKASNESQHVLREVERAVNRRLPLYVISMEPCTLSKSMEYFLLTNQWLDATSGLIGAVDILIDCLDKMGTQSIQGAMSENPEQMIVKTKNAGIEKHEKTKVSKKKSLLPSVLIIAVLLILSVSGIIAGFMIGKEKQDLSDLVSGKYVIDKKTDELYQNTDETGELLNNIDISAGDTEGNDSESKTEENEEPNPTEDVQNQAEDTSAEPKEQNTGVPASSVLQVGNYLQFGRYYPVNYSEEYGDGELVWQVLETDTTNHLVTLITDQIIDIKPFDCAESGRYGYDIYDNCYSSDQAQEYSDIQLCEFHGSGDYLSSDLRAWMNSDGVVTYSSRSQSDGATNDYGNAFKNQKGFLNSFTNSERGILCLQMLNDTDFDLVTLLSQEEVSRYMENGSFVLHPTVTKTAEMADETSWYNTYKSHGCTDYLWVTRTQCAFNASMVLVVDTSMAQDLFVPYVAAASGFGIRPVITLYLENVDSGLLEGEGSSILPYQLKGYGIE